MSDELKKCSCCGSDAQTVKMLLEDESGFHDGAACSNKECPMHQPFYLAEWQQRPLEDALTAECARLRGLVEEARDVLKELLYATEMRRNWDVLSKDEFDMEYSYESDWAFGDVDENMCQKMKTADEMLAKLDATAETNRDYTKRA